MTSVTLIATGPGDYTALRGAAVWRGQAVPEGGLEPLEVLAMLERWSADLQAVPGWGTWLAIAEGEVVASVAIKAAPVTGAVDIGYAVAPARRGQGLATAAVVALLAELAGHGVARVRAETAAGNPASGRVLEKAGFDRVGQGYDPEDGPLIRWHRTIASVAT